MNEQARLQELNRYRILDTPPEKELNDLTAIASAICDTPISLISLVDDTRQWFKARHGLDIQQTPRHDAFCQYALPNPNQVLVVDDPLHDERFRNNPLVLGNPHIRFYAGAPLETAGGYVLGTLCVIDNKPRHITESQKKALMLLARQVMDYMELRKLVLEQKDKIEKSAATLKKLTDQAPGVVYQFEKGLNGELSLPFISNGITNIHASLTPQAIRANPSELLRVIHPEDIAAVRQSMQCALSSSAMWSTNFRVVADDGRVSWVSADAKPEQNGYGTMVWYGTLRNTTERQEYMSTLEQILFDMSHIMRKPVANMLGLAAVMEKYAPENNTMKKHLGYIKTVSGEMDTSLRKLNDNYSTLRDKMAKKLSL